MRVRAKKRMNRMPLYPAGNRPGGGPAQWVTFDVGHRMVEEGKATRIHAGAGQCVGFEMRQPKAVMVIGPGGSQPSSGVLTQHEAEVAVGFHGHSETYGLTREQRARRKAAGLAEFDEIEAVMVKLDAFQPMRAAA